MTSALHGSRLPAAQFRNGVTLLELMVALALLGILTSIVGPALRPSAWTTEDTRAQLDIAALRRSAIETGMAVSAAVSTAGGSYELTALPDGSVIAHPGLRVDRLTGRVTDLRNDVTFR
jgi:prepilin-type N-terminal cleavage/methylation domain-containing protein